MDLYVFPINVGIKPTGVMFVEMFEGKWQAVTVTNYLDYIFVGEYKTFFREKHFLNDYKSQTFNILTH